MTAPRSNRVRCARPTPDTCRPARSRFAVHGPQVRAGRLHEVFFAVRLHHMLPATIRAAAIATIHTARHAAYSIPRGSRGLREEHVIADADRFLQPPDPHHRREPLARVRGVGQERRRRVVRCCHLSDPGSLPGARGARSPPSPARTHQESTRPSGSLPLSQRADPSCGPCPTSTRTDSARGRRPGRTCTTARPDSGSPRPRPLARLLIAHEPHSTP